MIDIHKQIGKWHGEPDRNVPLHIYLGMTYDQYASWFEGRMSSDELAQLGYYESEDK